MGKDWYFGADNIYETLEKQQIPSQEQVFGTLKEFSHLFCQAFSCIKDLEIRSDVCFKECETLLKKTKRLEKELKEVKKILKEQSKQNVI